MRAVADKDVVGGALDGKLDPLTEAGSLGDVGHFGGWLMRRVVVDLGIVYFRT